MKPDLDLDVDRRVRELVSAEAAKRTKRLKSENAHLKLQVPSWWVREYAHAAGGFVPALLAVKAGLPPAAPVIGVAAFAVAHELLQKYIYPPELLAKHPKWKSIVDVAAWVTGAAGGVLAAGG